MRATNFALRPLIRDEEDPSEGWELLEILHDDTSSVFTRRVGIVNVPNMGFTPLTLLQFALSCLQDQHKEEKEETAYDEGDFTEV